MDEIALKTGMSKKTIYQSFANKEEIVEAVVQEHILKSLSICEANVATAENAVHEIFLNIDMLEEMIGEMCPAVLEDLEKCFPEAHTKLYQHKNNYIFKKIQQNLQRGIAEGLYRDDINVDVVTRLRVEAMFIPFDQNAFPSSKYNIAEIEKVQLELFVYGLCTSEGQKQIRKYKQKRINQQL